MQLATALLKWQLAAQARTTGGRGFHRMDQTLMNALNAEVVEGKPRRRWPVVRVLFYLMLMCAIPPSLFLLITWINDVRYNATTAPLRSHDKTVREDAIRAFRGGGPEAAHSLGRALRDDPDPRVREGAARALAEFDQATLDDGYNPISDLRKAMKNDADARVREAAKDALEKLESR